VPHADGSASGGLRTSDRIDSSWLSHMLSNMPSEAATMTENGKVEGQKQGGRWSKG
jgi:hypothetical protein